MCQPTLPTNTPIKGNLSCEAVHFPPTLPVSLITQPLQQRSTPPLPLSGLMTATLSQSGDNLSFVIPLPRRCLTEPRWLAFFHSLLLVNLDNRSFFRFGLKGSACEHLAEQNTLLWNIVSGTFLYFEARPFTGSSWSTCKFGQNLTAPPSYVHLNLSKYF